MFLILIFLNQISDIFYCLHKINYDANNYYTFSKYQAQLYKFAIYLRSMLGYKSEIFIYFIFFFYHDSYNYG